MLRQRLLGFTQGVLTSVPQKTQERKHAGLVVGNWHDQRICSGLIGNAGQSLSVTHERNSPGPVSFSTQLCVIHLDQPTSPSAYPETPLLWPQTPTRLRA
jgi:hypothetical protein